MEGGLLSTNVPSVTAVGGGSGLHYMHPLDPNAAPARSAGKRPECRPA